MLSTVDNNWISRITLTLLLCCPALAWSAPVGVEAKVVAHLYRDYGWQAFASQQDLFGEGLEQQRRKVLGQYFNAQLVDLIAKDAECQVKQRGICRLDFDILFDSQDPVVADLEILVPASGKVQVRFTNPVNHETKAIDFLVARTAGRWKIIDVLYGPEPARSLKQVLLGR